MIIDGKKIAEEIIVSLEQERAAFGPLSLGVLMSSGDAATESFVKIKSRVAARLQVDVRLFKPDELEQALQCDGIIVQMPIDNAEALIAALPREKDVDALGERPLVLAPVAAAIADLFVRHSITAAGTKAVVVGAGRLVGVPAAALLRDLGAEVEVVTKNDGSLAGLKDADIVILGAGEPGIVKPEMLKEGVVLIDAGTSEASGRIAGDADPRCAEVASVFTPVPGGIGPIAVAMIFKNLFALKKAKENSDR